MRSLSYFCGLLAVAESMLLLSHSVLAEPTVVSSKQVYENQVKPFLKTHCLHCHDDQTTRAGFRIDTLGTDFLVGKTADHWKEMYDNIGVGKMPPKTEPRPTERESKAILDWIDQEIRQAERLAKNSPGRTRRLNRTEYFNTLRDLFDLDERYVRGLEAELPPDGLVDGFDRVGSSLYVDQSQLAKYVELAERILTEQVLTARPKVLPPIKVMAKEIIWNDRKESDNGKLTKVNAYPGQFGNQEWIWIPTGATIYELNNGGIEYLAGSYDTILGSHNSISIYGAGGGDWAGRAYGFFRNVTQEGKYRLRFKAGAFRGTGEYWLENVRLSFEYGKDPANFDTGSVVIDAPLDAPQEYVMEIYLRPRPNDNAGLRTRLWWNGVRPLLQEYKLGRAHQKGLILNAPEIFELGAVLLAEYNRIDGTEKQKKTPRETIDEMIKAKHAEVNEKYYRLAREYAAAKKPAFVYNPDFDLKAVPRLWLESWEVEGPLVDWPPAGRKKLFFDGEERVIDADYIQGIMARFLPLAYRRAVEPAEVVDWVNWTLDAQKKYQLSGLDAVKEGVKAVLCSPDFLFIQEPVGDTKQQTQPPRLTDYELANRLSYFLWSTMPDAELKKLAADQKLHDPKVLAGQVRRMIADPKGEGLVQNFAGQWLQIREFGKTLTDRNEFRTYTDDLRKASWQEPFEFFKEILHNNLSIIHFIDSDFVVIDHQLAKHYGIAGVAEADGFKRVAIRPEDHRGGVLGMAGVLTYLSDGFRTLPVRRAAYVLDVLWNEPAKPPPPNAGDLPSVRGKNLTVRQRLEQHRASASCASCHNHLDPFGVALENYDAIGRWRERQTGEGFRGDERSPVLDVSGTLPSGRAFASMAEYKVALLEEKDHFVRGFTKKVLTYALGRSVGVTDRETVEGIVKSIERDEYRLQTLIQAVVASDAFRNR